MAYNYPGTFALADSGSADAFGRLRISNPLRLLDEKAVAASPVLGNFASGGGSFSKPANRSSFYLTTGGVGSLARRQSRQRGIYQPGASQEVHATFTFGTPTTGIRQRVGYFDDNNGLYLELDGTTGLSFVVRSKLTGSVVNTAIARAAWQDKLDGTGPSGLTLDLTKSQILAIDFQWLGVGRVRFGFIINGLYVQCAVANQANIGVGVYMSNPNLPLRWEVEGVSSAAVVNLEAICGSIQSEGGFPSRGVSFAHDTDSVVKAVNGTYAYGEIIAIRLNAANQDLATSTPIYGSVLCTTTGAFMWEVWLNVAGMSGGAWTTPPGGVTEQNTTRTGSYTAGTGIKLASGWSVNAAGQLDFTTILNDGLGYDINAAAADILSLRVLNVTGNNDYHAALVMRQEA